MAKKRPTKADLEARERTRKNAEHLRELAERRVEADARAEQQRKNG